MVLSKPAGWVVNSATTTKAPVVQEWLENSSKFKVKSSKLERAGIVHRLDKETSGILVVAKTEAAMSELQRQFREREVEKEYLALVHGEVKNGGRVVAEVGRLPWNRERFGVLAGGRGAVTEYEVVGKYKILSASGLQNDNAVTLLRVKPRTGRTHQIRIHMKYIGHPVVADNFYAGRKTARNDRKWCPRLFLHAAMISFFDPDTHKKVSHKSDLPEDLKGVLDSLLL
jgi:23S rRNA pseudouridine1911/1915/1917 synthase